MKFLRFLCFAIVFALIFSSGKFTLNKDRMFKLESNEESSKVVESYNRLPLYFVKNDGQVDEKVKYYERGRGRTTFFTEDGVYLLLSRTKGENRVKDRFGKGYRNIETKRELETEYVVIKPYNADKGVEIEAEGELNGKVNYFTGNDPTKWRTNIPTYSKVRYKGIYEGIDLVFYGNQRELEYDVVVGPEGDLNKVSFMVEGAKDVREGEEGLEIELANGGRIVQRLPHIYQEIEGKKVEVSGRFDVKKNGDGEFLFGFDVSDYDRRYALIIDPLVLSYSTYLGGSDEEFSSKIAVDSQGNIYVSGGTSSTDFPTKNPYQASIGADFDILITKISSDGQSLIYSTYLGGNDWDGCSGMVVDSQGNVYIAGDTNSTDFPTKNPYQATTAGNDDAFITKISSDGQSLIYSTYLGGSDSDAAFGIAIDNQGNTYVTGKTWSTNFPLKNPYQANYNDNSDAFVTKLSPDGQNLIYSTYLGGTDWDMGGSIATDTQGNAYLTGYTSSDDFPTKNAYQANIGGGSDAFITKISPNGQSLIYSTYLGGSADDWGNDIVVDSQGNAYLTGNTFSNNFPTKNPYQTNNGGAPDAFITKISPNGQSLIYSTYLGGSSNEYGIAITIDNQGEAYIIGGTDSTDFPTKNPYQASIGGGTDAFISKISPNGQSLTYSTYLGGNADDWGNDIFIDTQGNLYVIGDTSSTNFPTTKNPFQANLAGKNDLVIAKFIDDSNKRLTINKSGNGSGTVTSNPSGINCGDDCTEDYPKDTSVTLTAKPDSGSKFGSWGGDCAGCGSNTNCQVTMNSNKVCSAEFIAEQLEDAGYDIKNDAAEDVETVDALSDTGSDVPNDISEDITDISKDIIADAQEDIIADAGLKDTGTEKKDTGEVDIGVTSDAENVSEGSSKSGCSCNIIE